MNWTQVLLTLVASAVVASFTDWYFFGVLFHDRYLVTPGVWRQYKDKKDEMRSIAIRGSAARGPCGAGTRHPRDEPRAADGLDCARDQSAARRRRDQCKWLLALARG